MKRDTGSFRSILTNSQQKGISKHSSHEISTESFPSCFTKFLCVATAYLLRARNLVSSDEKSSRELPHAEYVEMPQSPSHGSLCEGLFCSSKRFGGQLLDQIFVNRIYVSGIFHHRKIINVSMGKEKIEQKLLLFPREYDII